MVQKEPKSSCRLSPSSSFCNSRTLQKLKALEPEKTNHENYILIFVVRSQKLLSVEKVFFVFWPVTINSTAKEDVRTWNSRVSNVMSPPYIMVLYCLVTRLYISWTAILFTSYTPVKAQEIGFVHVWERHSIVRQIFKAEIFHFCWVYKEKISNLAPPLYYGIILNVYVNS